MFLGRINVANLEHRQIDVFWKLINIINEIVFALKGFFHIILHI